MLKTLLHGPLIIALLSAEGSPARHWEIARMDWK